MTEDMLGASQVPDFLRAKSDRAVKRELRGILQSYHHYWDILAELLQNARDAIERRKAEQSAAGEPVEEGRIHVTVDATHRSVEVIDNGTGIASDFIEEVLAPGGGDKSSNDDQVGEKALGSRTSPLVGTNSPWPHLQSQIQPRADSLELLAG